MFGPYVKNQKPHNFLIYPLYTHKAKDSTALTEVFIKTVSL